MCEIQTHAVFTGKLAAWQGFLKGTSVLPVNLMKPHLLWTGV